MINSPKSHLRAASICNTQPIIVPIYFSSPFSPTASMCHPSPKSWRNPSNQRSALSRCNASIQANLETHSSPTSTSTRRPMATKPIPTQQRATHLTNSKVTPPAPFIGISFNLNPESVDHPAASTFRSSSPVGHQQQTSAGTIRSSMDGHHKKMPGLHRDPSRS
ncbi:hypothetical protein ACLOJK_018946 [Asimina triloba]